MMPTKPQRVQFAHGLPRSETRYRRLFGFDVGFDAERSGIVLTAAWLDKRIEGGDPVLHGLMATAIQDAETRGPMSLGELVRGVLQQMVLNGTASGELVAALFAVHERTFRRRLREEGTSLQQLFQQTRFDLAQHLPQNNGLPVSAIATAFQYTDANAFPQALRTWTGVSASEWRARQ